MCTFEVKSLMAQKKLSSRNGCSGFFFNELKFRLLSL